MRSVIQYPRVHDSDINNLVPLFDIKMCKVMEMIVVGNHIFRGIIHLESPWYVITSHYRSQYIILTYDVVLYRPHRESTYTASAKCH